MAKLLEQNTAYVPYSEVPTSRSPVRIVAIKEHSYIDTMGVSLLSDRAKPEDREGIDFRYRPNSFKNSPSRFPNGKPHEIPVSGLEVDRLKDNYRGMMDILGLIRKEYLKTRPEEKGEAQPLSAKEMKDVLGAILYLPHYLTFRAKDPIDKRGTLPPSVIVLSNSGAGTIGALEGWIEQHEEDPSSLNTVPSVPEMIQIVENVNAMAPLGNKTVCAASPAQQEHFMTSVIYGPSDKVMTGQAPEFLDASDVLPLVKFSQAMNYGSVVLGAIKILDLNFYDLTKPIQMIAKEIPQERERADQLIHQRVSGYITRIAPYVAAMPQIDIDINTALGRESAPALGYSIAGLNQEIGLKMLDIISNMPVSQEKPASGSNTIKEKRRRFMRH